MSQGWMRLVEVAVRFEPVGAVRQVEGLTKRRHLWVVHERSLGVRSGRQAQDTWSPLGPPGLVNPTIVDRSVATVPWTTHQVIPLGAAVGRWQTRAGLARVLERPLVQAPNRVEPQILGRLPLT